MSESLRERDAGCGNSDNSPHQKPQTAAELLAEMAGRFAPAGQTASEAAAAAAVAAAIPPPVRTKVEWRPAPLLCKRFGVKDPHAGRAAEPTKRSRTVRTGRERMELPNGRW